MDDELRSIGTKTPFEHGGDRKNTSMANSDPRLPLFNLSVLGQKMESLRRFLTDSLDRNASIDGDQLQMVSTEIASAVQQIILNGAALLASSQPQAPGPTAAMEPVASSATPTGRDPSGSVISVPRVSLATSDLADDARGPRIAEKVADQVFSASADAPGSGDLRDLKDQAAEEDFVDCDIVEVDEMELIAEHVHFCEICGKGFKRDANLRMHMRAHGNRFKTLEALSKPGHRPGGGRKTMFSCPFAGCNRNRGHRKFRPLKSVVCVKNHFKRIHCPKMYSCNRCNKKSFSVVADLRSHLKHCGDCRWRCSCGTSFSRKDKLFGHVALFDGHMPAVAVVEERKKGLVIEEEEDEGDRGGAEHVGEALDPEFFEGLMEELGGIGRLFGPRQTNM